MIGEEFTKLSGESGKSITVVIPSYNQRDYLSSAIDSVFDQIKIPHSLIVVDDGSTDGSLEIANGYKENPKLEYKVISQVNKGLASARNTGIMNARTRYILFLDADDILLPNCIENIYKVIDETEADIISPSFKCFGVSNQEVILMVDPKLEDFKTGNRIGYCSAVKREALLEVGGYSPRMNFGYEDYAIWFDLLGRGKKIVTIPEVLWLYRTKEKSMMNDALAHHKELMAQIAKDFPHIFSEYA